MALMMKPVMLKNMQECSCVRVSARCRCGAVRQPREGSEVQDVGLLAGLPRVFAVDPGTHSGWACLWFDPDVLFTSGKTSRAAMAWWCGMVVGPELTQTDALLSRCRMPGIGGEGLSIVGEGFVVGELRQEETFLSPVRVLSMFRYGLWRGGREGDGVIRRRTINIQGAGDALSTCNDERLQLWQTYLPGPTHPRAAMSHAWLWLRRLGSAGEEFYDKHHFVDEEE
jgi:hypothetical protein